MDEIFSEDEGGTIVVRTPIRYKSKSKIVVRIKFDDGTEIIC